jgi:prevent-host-death family protein
MEWNLAEAKNRLTEVVNRAISEGPQVIRRRKDTVVVVTAEEFERLSGKKPGFKEFLFDGPSLEGVNLERDCSPSRDIDL